MQLVGEMELERRDIELPDGTVRNQLSTVHIKKCRYLEQSGCVGMCVNMCKVRASQLLSHAGDVSQIHAARAASGTYVTILRVCRFQRRSSSAKTWACRCIWSQTLTT